MFPFKEEAAARIKKLERRVRRLETLEETGCFARLGDVQLSSSAAVITFSDISQSFKHLWLWTDLLNSGATGSPSGFLRFNGDEEANYNWMRFQAATGANHGGSGLGDTLVTEIELRANTLFDISGGGHHEVNIIDYAATGKPRQVLWKGGGGLTFFAGEPIPTFDDVIVIGRGTWHNTADPITSLSISAFTVFDAGSRATLYGLC